MVKISDRIMELYSDIDGFTQRDAQSLQSEFNLSAEQAKTVYEAVKNGFVGESDLRNLAKIMGSEEANVLWYTALGLARNHWFQSKCWSTLHTEATSHLRIGAITYFDYHEMDCPNSFLMNGVEIPGGTKIALLEGMLYATNPRQETIVAGISVMPGKEVRYYHARSYDDVFENSSLPKNIPANSRDALDFAIGQVRDFTAARDFEKYGLQFKGETQVTLYPDGRFKSGQAGAGQRVGWVKWLADATVVFSNQGKVISLESPSYIFQIEARGKPHRGSGAVSFFENGVPQEVTLAQEEKIGGQTYPADTRVSFTPKGAVEAIHLTRPWPVRNKLVPADSTFYFNDAGNIDRILWGEDFVVAGIYFPSQSHLNFKDRGDIWKIVGEIVGPFKCPVLSEKKRSVTAQAEFFPDGKLKSVVLGIAQEIEGRNYPAGSELHFSRNGKVNRTFLPEYEPLQVGDIPTASCPKNRPVLPDF